MVDSLYLDTARIGQISPSAALACNAVGEIAAKAPQRVFEEITKVTESESSIIPYWRGLSGFQKSMLDCFEASDENRFFLASNSAALVKSTAQAIFLSSRAVFCTDLIWPRYRSILNRAAEGWAKQLNVMPVRGWLKHASTAEIVEKIALAFIASGSDALFLTAISSDGFKLPIRQIVHCIQQKREIRFIAVDGAQEFAQCDHTENWGVADIYLFSSHKWLGGYHPLTMGLYGKRRSCDFLETTVARMVNNDSIEDPLLRFQESFRSGVLEAASPKETINILPILAASGALHDLLTHARSDNNINSLKRNRESIAAIVESSEWNFVNDISEQDLQTQVATLQHKSGRSWSWHRTSKLFKANGIVCSAYDGGVARLSLPKRNLTSHELTRIGDSLFN